MCDIGKKEMLKNNHKSVATISGIVDGVAGFGAILGQLLIGPVESWKGYSGVFVLFSICSFIAPLTPLPYLCREVTSFIKNRKLGN